MRVILWPKNPSASPGQSKLCSTDTPQLAGCCTLTQPGSQYPPSNFICCPPIPGCRLSNRNLGLKRGRDNANEPGEYGRVCMSCLTLSVQPAQTHSFAIPALLRL